MRTTTIVALCLLTTACGSTVEQRTASAGLFGFGLGALAGGPLGAGIGLGAGLFGGALTPVGADQALDQVIGEERKAYSEVSGQPTAPPPQAGTTEAPTPVAPGPPLRVSPDTVKRLQSELQRQGLYNGPIDGIVGPKTRTALTQYQQRQGLPPTGEIDTTTLQRLTGGASGAGTSGTTGGQLMTTDQVRAQLQNSGYSNVSYIRPYGSNAYTAQAAQGNNTYIVDVDGRSGRVLSRRPVPSGSAQPSTGGTQPPQPGGQSAPGQPSQPPAGQENQ